MVLFHSYVKFPEFKSSKLDSIEVRMDSFSETREPTTAAAPPSFSGLPGNHPAALGPISKKNTGIEMFAHSDPIRSLVL